MGRIRSLFKLITGAANDLSEEMLEKNQMVVFRQEIREAEDALVKAKEALTSCMADLAMSDKKIKSLESQIEENMAYAEQALGKGKEELAQEILVNVQDLQNNLDVESQMNEQFKTQVEDIKANISHQEEQIRSAKSKISYFEAQDKLNKAIGKANKASSAAGANTTNLSNSSRIDSIAEKLDRVSEKNKAQAQMQRQSSGDTLKDKMRDAGIGKSARPSAQDMLAQLKAKQAK